MSIKKLILHSVGIASTLACVGFIVFAFAWMTVTGRSVAIWEPILWIRYTELVLFSFSAGYVVYLVRVVWFNQLKKLVWARQKKRFYR